MIIRKDKPFFNLPEPVANGTVELAIYPLGDPEKVPGSYARLILQMRHAELVDKRNESPLNGVPAYFALDRNCKRLEFYPTPDKDYYARFRYAPALKEI